MTTEPPGPGDAGWPSGLPQLSHCWCSQSPTLPSVRRRLSVWDCTNSAAAATSFPSTSSGDLGL